MNDFLDRLKQRKLVQWALAYMAAGFALIQVVDIVAQRFGWPEITVRLVIIALAIGFFVTLVLAWYHGERGAQRVTGTELSILALLLAIGGGILWRFAPHVDLPGRSPAAPTSSPVGAETTLAAESKSADSKSIAVLPFENLSEDKANAYFATGIQDEILTRLSKIGALKIISRNSTSNYASRPDNLPYIARQLGVANILEGSVQKSGDMVHVNVQLIRAASGENLWADSYDRKLDNIFAVEGEVAQSIAETLRARLGGAEREQLSARPTQNLAAYEAYLRGLALDVDFGAHSPNVLSSISAFEEAVVLDPRFGLAWAHLSRLQSFASLYEGAALHRQAAQNALAKAFEFAPDSIETQLADGLYHYWGERDYEGAKARLRAVGERAPSNSWVPYALAAIARRQGQWLLSRQLFEQGIALDPKNVGLLVDAARTDLAMRKTDDALAKLDLALTITPAARDVVVWRALALQMRGDFAQAQAQLDPLQPGLGDVLAIAAIVGQAELTGHHEKALAVLKAQLAQPEALGAERGLLESQLGDLQRLDSDAATAEQTYRRGLAALDDALTKAPDNPDFLAWRGSIQAGLGNRAAALADLQRAVELRPASLDAMDGPVLVEALVRVQARFGDKDAALAGLRQLLTTNYAPPSLTPAMLRLDPDWENLRSDPRFRQLIASAVDTVDGTPRP